MNASITRSWRPYGATILAGLRRRRRVVHVHVLVDGHEEDRFEVGCAFLLRAALKPLDVHLPRERSTVRFLGSEDQWLPLGLGRTGWRQELPSRAAALAFLAG